MDQKYLSMNSHLTHLAHPADLRRDILMKRGALGESLNRLFHLGEPGENPSWLILPENFRLITEFRSRATRTRKSEFSTKASLVAIDSSLARTLLLDHRADLLEYDPHLRSSAGIFGSTAPSAAIHRYWQCYRAASVRRRPACNTVSHTCDIHDES